MNLELAKRVLKLQYRVSESELKSIYRKLAIELHPDTNKSPYAKQEFQSLNIAYQFMKRNLNALPLPAKPKLEGVTIFRMFQGGNKQLVHLPIDSVDAFGKALDNINIYFTWRGQEFKTAIKKDTELPMTADFSPMDLLVRFEIEEQGPENWPLR